jgi:hypothetical protein
MQCVDACRRLLHTLSALRSCCAIVARLSRNRCRRICASPSPSAARYPVTGCEHLSDRASWDGRQVPSRAPLSAGHHVLLLRELCAQLVCCPSALHARAARRADQPLHLTCAACARSRLSSCGGAASLSNTSHISRVFLTRSNLARLPSRFNSNSCLVQNRNPNTGSHLYKIQSNQTRR